MKIVILEDEPLAAERLKNLLTGIDSELNTIAHLKSVEQAVSWFTSHPHPDLVLSDIRLLDGLSFELFQQVEITVPIIFTTAYDQYAIKAFEVNSVDYLLKPIQAEKLSSAIQKIRLRMIVPSQVDYAAIMNQLMSSHKEFKSRFMVRVGQKIVSLPVEKIAYFFSQNKLTFVVMNDQKKYPLDQALDELIELLNPKIFFRVNRQFIVSFSSIAEIHPYFKGRIKLQLSPPGHEEVVISSERTPEFKQWIDQ
jgi:two-component system, LytTR family, response regulator LytT